MVEKAVMFRSLELLNWRQFKTVKLDFHDRLTILTGRNGCGKSSILRILEAHFLSGRQPFFVSTSKFGTVGEVEFSSDSQDNFMRFRKTIPKRNIVGMLKYNDDSLVHLSVPFNPKSQYVLDFDGQKRKVPGYAVLSEGVEAYYTQISTIPTDIPDPKTFYQKFMDLLIGSQQLGGRALHMKRKGELIRIFMHGLIRDNVVNKQALSILEQFQEALVALLPPELDFRRIEVRGSEVVFQTKNSEFSMDSMSHGISRIVDLAWMGVLLSLSQERFVITIDEPENHLHPSMQQQLVANLVSFFDQAQFIVATHSPLVVTSVRDSHVYVLDFDEVEPSVDSILLDSINKAGTANEILRKVLGLSHTMPIWAEIIINEVADELAEKNWSEQEVNLAAHKLEENGLLDYAPQVIQSVIEKKNRKD